MPKDLILGYSLLLVYKAFESSLSFINQNLMFSCRRGVWLNFNIPKSTPKSASKEHKTFSKEDILYYLDTFKGAKRRFDEEVVLDSILVDDYAHHPTEIKTVIETARQKYPEKTVVAVLIPYTLSRAKAFYKEFADVIKLADKAFVTEIEPAREKLEDYPGITSKMILDLTPGAEMISAETIDKLYDYKNSVILFMGCKDSSYLRDAYKKGKLKWI